MNIANVFHLRARVQEDCVHFQLLFVMGAADGSQYSRPLSRLSEYQSIRAVLMGFGCQS